MQRTPWLNVLIILLVIIAASYLAQMVLQFLGGFSDTILLFVLAWLVAFALGPLIERLNGKPLPDFVARGVERVLGQRAAYRVAQYRASRGVAVGIVYLGLVVALAIIVFQFVPPALAQLNQLGSQLPDVAQRAPEIARLGQGFLARIGLNLNLEAALQSALGGLQSYATPVLQNVVTVLASVVALIGNLLLVLILSLFFALDGPRLMRAIFDLIPAEYDDEVLILVVTIDRTFGGFIRAQLVQAFLVGVGTGVVMALFGGQFVLVTSLLAGLFMLIPFIGPVFSLIPPLIAMLLTSAERTPLVVIVLLVYQLVISNVLMPKLLSDALGLHPLVIIGALLLGVKVAGFWGAFFGVPVAGVIATMALFFYRRFQRMTAATRVAPLDGARETAPPGSAAASAPSTPATAARDLEKKSA